MQGKERRGEGIKGNSGNMKKGTTAREDSQERDGSDGNVNKVIWGEGTAITQGYGKKGRGNGKEGMDVGR